MDANKFVCKVYSPDFVWTFSFKLSCAIMLSLGLVAFWADSLNTFRLSEVTAKAVIASVVPAMTALREDHNDEGAGPERVLRDRRAMVRETLENERANMVSGGLRVLVIDRDGCEFEIESAGLSFFYRSMDHKPSSTFYSTSLVISLRIT